MSRKRLKPPACKVRKNHKHADTDAFNARSSIRSTNLWSVVHSSDSVWSTRDWILSPSRFSSHQANQRACRWVPSLLRRDTCWLFVPRNRQHDRGVVVRSYECLLGETVCVMPTRSIESFTLNCQTFTNDLFAGNIQLRMGMDHPKKQIETPWFQQTNPIVDNTWDATHLNAKKIRCFSANIVIGNSERERQKGSNVEIESYFTMLLNNNNDDQGTYFDDNINFVRFLVEHLV